MKVSKEKFNECLDYFRQINTSDLEDLDLSEFSQRIDSEQFVFFKYTGLNNTEFIKMLM